MDGQTGERVLTAGEVEAALSAHGFGIDRSAAGAVVLALNDPLRVVWANKGATRLFGTRDALGLQAQVFAGRGRDGLGAAVQRLVPGGGARLERLRLFRGFRTRTLTVSVSRTRLADGEDLFVLAVPTLGEEGAFAASDLAGAGATPTRIALPTVVAPDEAAAWSPPAPAPVPPQPAPPAPAPMAAAGREAPPVAAPLPRLDHLGSRRFLWQTDADGRLVALTDGVPDLAGQGGGPAAGEPFFAWLAATGADPEGAAAEAAAARRSWSGLRLLWPLARLVGHVPVLLGAIPIKGPSGGFDGFRGFGVADFTKAVVLSAPAAAPAPVDPAVAPEAPVAPAAPSEPAGAASPERTEAPSPPTEMPDPGADLEEAFAQDLERDIGESRHPAGASLVPALPHDWDLGPDHRENGEAGHPADRSRAPEARDGFASGKVVALRPFQIFANGVSAPPLPPLPPPAVEPPARRRDDLAPRDRTPAEPNLSSTEQFNFHEIARALRGPAEDRPGATVAAGADSHAAVLAGLPVAVLVGSGGRLVYANDAFATLTGYASVEAVETAGGLDHLLGGLSPAQVADAEADRAFPIVDAAGRVLAVEGRATTQVWGGAPALVLTMRPAADRATQVQALEMDLRRREAEANEARALLDLVDAAAVVDGQGRLLLLNGAGEALFGTYQNGVVGEPIGTLLTPESQNAALGAVLAASAANAPEGSLAVQGRRAAGGAIPLRMRLKALGPGRVGIVFRDAAEVEGLQREIGRLRAERGHGDADLPDMLAKVSHEVRTPLNAILGFAEIMLDERFGPVGNPRYKDYLSDIRAAGAHVMDVVGDLLDLSKMQAGRLEMKVAAIDVNRVIGEAVADMQGHAHRDRVIMRLSLLPHLPNALVDETAIRQVMGNILSNAIRYNEPGGQVIVSTALNEMKAITVRVRDTGIGMTEAEIAAAMEPFRTVGTDKAGGGSGLGLPLTRALVEANQATMAIRSRKNEGTLVEIVLRPSQDRVSEPAA